MTQGEAIKWLGVDSGDEEEEEGSNDEEEED